MASSDSYGHLLRVMVRAAVRFCMKRNLAVSALIDAVSAEYIGQASEAAQSQHKRVTVSQLSVMTGFNRRRVGRLLADTQPREARLSLPARVIAQWTQDRRYSSALGKANILRLSGASPSFHELVSSVSKDVNPASVLRELERTGTVVRVKGGLRLAEEHYSLKGDPERGLQVLAADMETLTRAVEENVYDEQEVLNLHLRTEYDNVFLADIPKIRAELRRLGAKLHQDVRTLLAAHDQDLNPERSEPAGGKIVLGTFSWSAAEPEK